MLVVLPSVALGAPPIKDDPLVRWKNAPWDETDPAVADWLGDEGKELSKPWDFGPYYAARAALDVEIAGMPFHVYVQMDRDTDRLGQLLLERRQNHATPIAWERIAKKLIAAYGEPRIMEMQAKRPHEETGGVTRLVLGWSLPAAGDRPPLKVIFGWTDFMTNALLFRNPNLPLTSEISYLDARKIVRRFLPRRILIRIVPDAG